MTPFLQLRDIHVDFGGFQLSIDGEFSLAWTGLFGPSGAGKTTLLEIIAGLRRPKSGRLVMNKELLFDAQQKIFIPPHRRHIGYVSQDLALFPHLTVRANLAYGQKSVAPLHGPPSFDNLCELFEIGALLEKKPGSLSGGEKQRVACARALLAGPRLLLLDEPLSGLDQPLKERILPLLIRLRDELKIPTLYVTHSADEVVALCQHVIMMGEGKITAQGRPQDLFVPSPLPTYRLR